MAPQPEIAPHQGRTGVGELQRRDRADHLHTTAPQEMEPLRILAPSTSRGDRYTPRCAQHQVSCPRSRATTPEHVNRPVEISNHGFQVDSQDPPSPKTLHIKEKDPPATVTEQGVGDYTQRPSHPLIRNSEHPLLAHTACRGELNCTQIQFRNKNKNGSDSTRIQCHTGPRTEPTLCRKG